MVLPDTNPRSPKTDLDAVLSSVASQSRIFQ